MTIQTIRRHLGAAPKPERLRMAIAVAIGVHLLAFFFSPPIEPRSYVMAAEQDTIVVVLGPESPRIPEDRIPPPPEPPAPDPFDGDPVDEPVPPPPPPPAPPPPDGRSIVVPKPPPGSGPFVPYDRLPRMIERHLPSYPQLAREAGIEGTVFVRVTIGTDGRVVRAVVDHSNVPRSMERVAVAAARRCRFEPARQGSIPVVATVVMPFEFRLER